MVQLMREKRAEPRHNLPQFPLQYVANIDQLARELGALPSEQWLKSRSHLLVGGFRAGTGGFRAGTGGFRAGTGGFRAGRGGFRMDSGREGVDSGREGADSGRERVDSGMWCMRTRCRLRGCAIRV
eukprot:1177336-Prorocentrum_minimum.AAC.2